MTPFLTGFGFTLGVIAAIAWLSAAIFGVLGAIDAVRAAIHQRRFRREHGFWDRRAPLFNFLETRWPGGRA
jgi:hypothetical protein